MSDTSKREELIRALAADVHDEYGWLSDAQHARLEWDEPNRVVHFCGEEDVFEQAHTPTEDAREALIGRAQGITENMKVSAGDRRGDEWCYIRYRDVDALQAVLAALRRTAVQEPGEREAKVHGELVTMRVKEWRRITDELARLRTMEPAEVRSTDTQGDAS